MNASIFQSFEKFNQFWNRIQDLYKEGKTTGDNQSDAMMHYTQMSLTRMKRGLQHYQIYDDLKKAINDTKCVNWLLITEAWCGDASNTVPIIALASELNTSIQLRVMVRDEHPEIMANFLTNGAKSIPILVLFDSQFNEIGKWGPRPSELQDLVLTTKANGDVKLEELMTIIQKWYIQDATKSTQSEITSLLTIT